MNQQLLVIDDTPKVHPLVKAILAQEPVDVHSATDPAYGLTLAASLRPDLILLDIDMPEMNGFDACLKLKANPATAHCPVIFLTAHATFNEKVMGFELGAIDYVTKPFNPGELLARVRTALKMQHAIRTLKDEAVIDPLTGLGNQAMFDRRLEAELGLRDRLQHSLSVTVISVARFDDILMLGNHVAAEQVLRKVGKVIRDHCRPEDVACRLRNEEFVILSPHTAAGEAAIAAERIRKAVAAFPLQAGTGSSAALAGIPVSITVHFGVADAASQNDRAMLKRAGDSMRKARQLSDTSATRTAPMSSAA